MEKSAHHLRLAGQFRVLSEGEEDGGFPHSLKRETAASKETRFESFGLPFQQRLRDGFRALAVEFPRRCRLIDAAGTPDDVAVRIDAALDI